MNPDGRALEDMVRIRGTNLAFVKWLESRASEYQRKLVDAGDEVELRKMQGKAKELLDILDLIQRSPEILTKQRVR